MSRSLSDTTIHKKIIDNGSGYNVEEEVLARYAKGANARESGLCCPVSYNTQYLEILPKEILQKDYGCGDPSQYVREGETVIDLGSGAGKICYILAQKVGPNGQVIGVDFNEAMLQVARKYLDEIAQKIGCHNVRFMRGRIQDLGLDLERVEKWLQHHPIHSVRDMSVFEQECERLRKEQPLIPDGSADVVVSNCVLNLVRPEDKKKLFGELHRVLRKGGRAVISDIVSDEDVPAAMIADPELWSGCIAGAFREDTFLHMFEEADFYGIEILSRQEKPWKVIKGIEFRSITIQAFKGKEGPCMERNQAVIYKGPWKVVQDDDGHPLYRGQKMAVCDKTFQIMLDADGPYGGDIIGVCPHEKIAIEEAEPFDCATMRVRESGELKGKQYNKNLSSGATNDECCPECS